VFGIAVTAWIVAFVLAIVVLAFCAYEIVWKSRRLQADLAKLQEVALQLQGMQTEVAAVQSRLAGTDAG
jgi:hypothetical protein